MIKFLELLIFDYCCKTITYKNIPDDSFFGLFKLIRITFYGVFIFIFFKEFLEGFLHRSHYSVVKVSIVIVVSCMAFHFIIQ